MRLNIRLGFLQGVEDLANQGHHGIFTKSFLDLKEHRACDVSVSDPFWDAVAEKLRAERNFDMDHCLNRFILQCLEMLSVREIRLSDFHISPFWACFGVETFHLFVDRLRVLEKFL